MIAACAFCTHILPMKSDFITEKKRKIGYPMIKQKKGAD
jgi:hypothetical protein